MLLFQYHVPIYLSVTIMTDNLIPMKLDQYVEEPAKKL